MIENITAENAYQAAQKGAILVDVRESIEVEDVWMDMQQVMKKPLSVFAKEYTRIPKDKEIILCCAIGLSSEIAAKILDENGYKKVKIIENGLIAWQKAKLPTKAKYMCHCGNENKEQNK